MLGDPKTIPGLAWIALGAVLFTVSIITVEAFAVPRIWVFVAGIAFAELADRLVTYFNKWGEAREKEETEATA